MRDVHDNDTIEELLVRSGDYLMERTAQYREQPVHTSTARQAAPRWLAALRPTTKLLLSEPTAPTQKR